jgi:hypothetical protein
MDNPTVNVNTQAAHYSPTEYIDGTPPIFKDILRLFFKPKNFFTSEIAVGKTPYILFVVLVLGISAFIERVDKELLRLLLGNPRPGIENILPYVVDSWLNFWGIALLYGSISGFFIWKIGGWWYKVRLKWSGAKEPETIEEKKRFSKQVGIIYIYTSFVAAFPSFLLVFIYMFIFKSYRIAFNADEYYSLIFIIFPFWSVIVSYKAVNAIFTLRKWAGKLWFLILPILIYLIAFGILATIGALFLA